MELTYIGYNRCAIIAQAAFAVEVTTYLALASAYAFESGYLIDDSDHLISFFYEANSSTYSKQRTVSCGLHALYCANGDKSSIYIIYLSLDHVLKQDVFS